MNLFTVLLRAAAALFTIFFALGVFIFAFLFWDIDAYHIKALSDGKLISIFNNHRPAFEKLRQMAEEDFKRNPRDNSPFSIEALKPAKQKEYRRLLNQIEPGLDLDIDTINYPAEEFVSFTFAQGGTGPLGDDWTKGIVFIPGNAGKVGKLEKSLDDWDDLPSGEYYLRPIANHWFLSYDIY
jgi:hypothetical protein